MANPLVNIGALTMEEIQNLLFDNSAPWNNPGAGLHGRRPQVDETFLCEIMKVLVSRSERAMQAQLFKMEWNHRCFTRIRQILKHNLPSNSTNPFYSFMGSGLRDMREILWDLDRVLSRMRTATQFLGDVDRRMRTGRTGGPISVWSGQPAFGSRAYAQQAQQAQAQFGVASGSGVVHQPNRPPVGPPRGRQMERGTRGARGVSPIVLVRERGHSVGWYNFQGQGERSGPAGRGKGKGKGKRSNVGAEQAGGAGRPGPSGAGSGARARGGSGAGAGAGARSGPSGRDSPSAPRFNVRGRARDPSRSPRVKRESPRVKREPTRSRSRPRATGRMSSPPPLTDTSRSRSRSRSRATEESSDPEGRSRSRTPRGRRTPKRSSRSPPRTGNREVRVSQDEAIDLSSGENEYMETDM